MSIPQRKFRIEGGTGRSTLEVLPVAFEAPAIAIPEMPVAARIETSPSSTAVLDEVRALRMMIEPLYGVLENLKENYREELRSFASLKVDMTEIESAIAGTKKELAALKVGHNIGGVEVAALELETVVSQTEVAANDILAAAESIETMAGAIQSETTLDACKGLANDIADKVTIIYMACNFQDLSGQRVRRVVDTLNFVESRIHKMIDAWGGLQALHELIEQEIQTQEEERETEGSAALLTGPAPVNAEDHVDQDAIDALFH
ncbi:MAG: protein phosphatase CheZ [Methylobacterium sp.]|nr:protein phosphatase CheZ [Methylobacterium sp.]